MMKKQDDIVKNVNKCTTKRIMVLLLAVMCIQAFFTINTKAEDINNQIVSLNNDQPITRYIEAEANSNFNSHSSKFSTGFDNMSLIGTIADYINEEKNSFKQWPKSIR